MGAITHPFGGMAHKNRKNFSSSPAMSAGWLYLHSSTETEKNKKRKQLADWLHLLKHDPGFMLWPSVLPLTFQMFVSSHHIMESGNLPQLSKSCKTQSWYPIPAMVLSVWAMQGADELASAWWTMDGMPATLNWNKGQRQKQAPSQQTYSKSGWKVTKCQWPKLKIHTQNSRLRCFLSNILVYPAKWSSELQAIGPHCAAKEHCHQNHRFKSVSQCTKSHV